VYGTPAAAAAAATAYSPSWCIIRVKPVGARTSGMVDGRPSSVVVVSASDTSRNTRGRNSTRANAARLRAWLSSPSAAPST
jgi:hypothetical protein